MVNEGKFNKYLDVEVSCKDKTDGTGKWLSFFGINPGDEQAIKDRLIIPGTFNPMPNKHISKAWFKSGVLNVVVPKGEEDAFIDSGLKSIQSALIKSGKYNADGVLALTDEVAQKMDTISDDEKKQLYKDAEVSEIEMWKNYLNKVNDPETRKILELYSQIYGNTVYGHLLSLRNAMIIRNLNPDATFVLGASTWQQFGRGVKRGAKKYPLYGATYNRQPSQKDIEQAQKELNHEAEEWGDLGAAVKQAIMIQASKGKGIPVFFKYIGYDIADTYLYRPSEGDPMLTEPGITSNVVRKLNSLAQAAEAKKEAEKGGEISGHTEMKDKTVLALEALQNFCKERGIQIPKSNGGDASAELVDGLMSVYSSMAQKKANVLTQGNINKVAEDCTHLTLIMDNIGLDQLSRFSHPLTYTQKDMAALAPMLRSVVYAIGKAANNINESIGEDEFMNRLKMAMKQIGMNVVNDNIESINENFNKWLKRINNADISKPFI